MTNLKTLCASLVLASLSGLAMAADNPLSVHVLNLNDGLPSPDVKVTLEKQNGQQWTALNDGVTNQQGRITALYPQDKALEKGTYRVTFKTGDWFEAHDTASFFPEVPVIFEVDGTVPHYHIPLLLSPYGFSTYRGN
ncbi:hydroxyisourate hydrolase [Stutzerimonas zhaodongensis]|uniref:5-hydroxyisourate hydrolase n=1 Tax=Stutzerimonas zhaodongensis TaxID=1176257 RepID=A0A3M2HQK1_9GAMM|nr:hydroxyisourate hydrolase [Stutzerimonas zhaodongensis]MCQ4315269.1 hydroxyisourate hydrolase [Stutzerimonas zhaodongensis]RMH90163.1 hydroxyisourate hydrolase [Stutzerimonas zhaodongensis]